MDRYRILVVEKEDEIRGILSDYPHVEKVSTVIEAKDIIMRVQSGEKEKPDLVITRRQVEPVNGYYIAGYSQTYMGVPVIMIDKECAETLGRMSSASIQGVTYLLENTSDLAELVDNISSGKKVETLVDKIKKREKAKLPEPTEAAERNSGVPKQANHQ